MKVDVRRVRLLRQMVFLFISPDTRAVCPILRYNHI